ncbi:Centrosomal protein of 112 kDa [Frankliniella fusca]|uniref:Centrosomal protein of 112 kDa n=1 Tax=Frankliniella fusca TaxID=407009 RepID=A0AAE1GRQ9_9NEOP|nr:Centrosomal protein of 112 kDa [Frankliniella fusca]
MDDAQFLTLYFHLHTLSRGGAGAMETEETEQTLNYDFNFNMVLGKTLISKLSLPQERLLATEWLHKLSTCGTALEELQLRNMFAYFLVLSLQEGQLRPPFDAEPPAAPLPSLQHLLPGEAYEQQCGAGAGSADEEAAAAAAAAAQHQQQGGGGGPGYGRPPPYEYSPDGGEFFAAQPVPRCGAFCYLAVVARQDQ